MAINEAMEDVREQRVLPVPVHLRDTHYKGAARLGRGEGYEYPHDAEEGWLPQDYLGVDREYYHPVSRGYEQTIRERLEDWRKRRRQQVDEKIEDGGMGGTP
jgi:putative ATPase